MMTGAFSGPSSSQLKLMPLALTFIFRPSPQLGISIRHPEVRAAVAASLEGRRPGCCTVGGRASFEARLRRAPQDDGERVLLVAPFLTSAETPSRASPASSARWS